MLRKVIVTGIGIISAIGNNAEETLVSFHNLKSGIGKLTLFNSIHDDIPVGEVKLTKEELVKLAGITNHKGLYTRTALLGLIAAQQAVSGAGFSKFNGTRTGLVSATSVGGMDLNEQYYKSLLENDTFKDYLEVFDSGDSAEKIAGFFGIKHHVTTISTACSSSANSIMTGARLIRNNQLDRVLVGGTDSLTKFTLNGFFALEILSPTGCRPFDRDRNGLTIGEGAAFLLLEAEDVVADKSKALCQVTGFANTNEAFHQTSSSSDGYGAFMAMEKALKTSGLQPSQIGYINAHGTGTLVNDLSEGRAIKNLFSTVPKFSSTKAFTGHTLGAAGAIEAVFSVLSLKKQILLPNFHFTTPIDDLFLSPQVKVENAVIEHVMSNSFGFGGSNTSLIFSKL